MRCSADKQDFAVTNASYETAHDVNTDRFLPNRCSSSRSTFANNWSDITTSAPLKAAYRFTTRNMFQQNSLPILLWRLRRETGLYLFGAGASAPVVPLAPALLLGAASSYTSFGVNSGRDRTWEPY